MSPSKTKSNVGVVEDDPSVRQQLASALRPRFNVVEGGTYQSAYQLLGQADPAGLDVLLLDLQLPDGGVREGVALLRELAESELDTVVIVLSDNGRKSTALRVVDAGAYDFFVKPVDPDALGLIVTRAVDKLHIERENRILREELKRKDALGDLLGSTEAMRDLFESIRRVARTPTTVVIRGESGSGKELVARALHDLSPRRDRAFVSLNCAALPETLMEAELFGYERGAFTGAHDTKQGRIELAHRGTLFLDEIGTLTPALQSKLLRVLEEHMLVRLGGRRSIKVDFRLVTATNENLEELVRQRRFREDLYYRIHVVPLFVPPLRERGEDIPLLVDYFVRVYCAANHLPAKKVDNDALQALKRYPWPGNVRELENVVQRMVLMSDGDLITPKHLPPDVVQAVGVTSRRGPRLPASGIRLEEEVAAFERQCLELALQECNGVKAQAAQRLGINKDKIKYLCRKYGL